MSIVRLLTFAGVLAAGVLGGCASNLPVYPPMKDADALTTIAQRQGMVKSLSAECDLDLTDAQGQRISLDAVLIAEPPGRLRLRAWKFGQAVFDLTLVDGKGWVMVPGEGTGESSARRMDVSKVPAQRILDAMDLLGPTYFREAHAIVSESADAQPETVVVRASALGSDDVMCEIDRKTLTARRFVVGGGGTSQAATSELLLDTYDVVNMMVWPMRMRLRSPTGEVMVQIRELEINGEIPAKAFVPPARAKELP